MQLARHPQRPYSLDYINYLSPDFLELHGDRFFADDPSIVCGIGTIDGKRVMYLGQQKGRNTNDNLHRNFGMMRPEGYRKALRVMKLAEKFKVPIISLIDTMGAFPGLGAEERGQGEAIARNLFEMSQINVPILIIVIGEGASGGALGIGVGDRFLMLENTWKNDGQVYWMNTCCSGAFTLGRWHEMLEALKPVERWLEQTLANNQMKQNARQTYSQAV